jgi:predicted SAM-dependent methyltransferase
MTWLDGKDEPERLRLYLESPPRKVRPGLLGSVADRLPPSVSQKIRLVGTRIFAEFNKRKARRLLGAEPLLLHLGCGSELKLGWINVDLWPVNADLHWDLRMGIPFPTDCADGVFHEHVLEHIPKPAGLKFLQECFRVLKPTGVLRVVVPNAGNALRGYVKDDGRTTILYPSNLMGIEALFYENGHVSMFDSQTLAMMLRAAGFEDVREREFGDSSLPGESPDSESRRPSLYVEGRKYSSGTTAK